MANVRIEDQKDKDGVLIGQYAHFRELSTKETVLSKEEVIKRIAKLQEELDHYKEILATFTI